MAFLQIECPSLYPPNSVSALKSINNNYDFKNLGVLDPTEPLFPGLFEH